MDLNQGEEFWCELVINGIGGRTITEAKANISNPELMLWRSYRKKYGSLFFGRRIEQAAGNMMAFYARNNTSEQYRHLIDAFNYMPHEESKMLKDEVTLEDYMESLCAE
ncbi:hypothetical protein ACG904_20510 [Acinetobacter guillouiae]|uniref:hypothetical protein n=1 Tax=Acinetobacter guillouiae TaxID=106649 RepID=UPI003AF5F7CA